MTRMALTIKYYSFYLFLIGAGLMFGPNLLLGILGINQTQEVWIRIIGLFAFTTGIYYYYSSLYGQFAFYRATIAGRSFFFVSICLLVVVLGQSPALIAVGGMDLIGALWTLWAWQTDEGLKKPE